MKLRKMLDAMFEELAKLIHLASFFFNFARFSEAVVHCEQNVILVAFSPSREAFGN